jgi:hypothetical protein
MKYLRLFFIVVAYIIVWPCILGQKIVDKYKENDNLVVVGAVATNLLYWATIIILLGINK